jgi:hypothetical protein
MVVFMAEIIPFKRTGGPKPPLPPLRVLVERVHSLAQDANNIEFNSHLQGSMNKRGRTMREVMETVKHGVGVSGPTEDQYGDLKIKLRKCVHGRRIFVIVAVREKDFSIVTVF